MKARNRLVVSINFYNGDIARVEAFYKAHRYTHAEVYLKGIEALGQEEKKKK